MQPPTKQTWYSLEPFGLKIRSGLIGIRSPVTNIYHVGTANEVTLHTANEVTKIFYQEFFCTFANLLRNRELSTAIDIIIRLYALLDYRWKSRTNIDVMG